MATAPKTPLEIGVLLTGAAVQYTDLAPVDLLAMLTPDYLAMLGPATAPLLPHAVPMNVSYISEAGAGTLFPLTAGAQIAVTHSLTTAPPLDILIIPGPPPVPVSAPAVDAFIRAAVTSGRTTLLSVCSGILPTAASGVLDGRGPATAPLGMLGELRKAHPTVGWKGEARWEKSVGGVGGAGGGDVWTSGSVANGVDMMVGFMRERWGGEVVEVVVAVAGVAGRGREYDAKELEMGEAFVLGGEE